MTAADTIVSVTALGIRLPDPARRGWINALDSVDLDLAAGRTTAVVGETGAGKSMLLAALVGLLPTGAQVRGSILHHCVDGTTDLLRISDRQWRRLRGRQIGWWSQQAMFTATRTVRSQLQEACPTAPLADLAVQCRLVPPLLDRRPHELSGGELRRAAAVAALLHEPALLLADEPTAGLGIADIAAVSDLLAERRRRDHAAVVVTHELDFAASIADTIAVMRDGRVVEHGPVDRVLAEPSHPYTRALVVAGRLGAKEDQ